MRAPDALTVALMRHRFEAIAAEMVETLARTCFSPILNQSHDFSALITDGAARALAQAERVPIHMGAMPYAVEIMAKRFEGQLRPGDMIVANDPYLGGSHLPDVTMAQPVFAPDGRIAFWSVIRAHQGDIGGMSAGSYSPAAREIWHEGLRIPPMRLVEGGVLREELIDLFALNSRRGDDLRGDMMAQMAAVRAGSARLADIAAREEPAVLNDCCEALLASGEAGMQALIEACKPGVYDGRSWLEDEDGEGLIPVPVTVTVTIERGEGRGRITVDLRQAPDQTTNYLNSPLANSRASVIVALLYMIGDSAALNDGALRPVTILTRPGSLLDPREPAPVASCTSLAASAIIEAVLQAMAEALPERAIAGFARRFRFTIAGSQHGEDGEPLPFIWHSFFNRGGAGANGLADGWPNLGGIHNPGGTPSPSIEVTEQLYPLVVESYRLLPEAGGRGQHRGGAGGEIRLRYDGAGPALINATGDGLKVPPYGLAGGEAGSPHDYRIERADGNLVRLGPREAGLRLEPGDVLCCRSAGGGGVGTPALL
ncbi:hydantoinase B/oxoprolinase family protein [Pseudogemmobacter sonorensis]|uniref:hydantoinase B/oxoprolinase family protein n=1 Tax=Pseudogemmobacter sonorensis TaxID=2989681 RepID=UPI0036BC8A61